MKCRHFRTFAFSLFTITLFWSLSFKYSNNDGVITRHDLPALILFYNPLFWPGDHRVPPNDFQSDYINCPYKCNFTFNIKYASEANVVVFNINRGVEQIFPATRKKFRRPDQLWVMLSWESAMHWQNSRRHRHLVRLASVFNWTWTYRLDSDVVFSYGLIQRRAEPDLSRMFDYLSTKHKMAIFMESNCYPLSKREELVVDLIKAGFEIDVIGACADNMELGERNISEKLIDVCQRDELFSTSKECINLIVSTYKFYLGFENSLCPDYVTEKFYRPASLNIIPVVLNGANMSLFAPDKSYIDTKKFIDVQQLANYLRIVGSDADLYNSYFSWKPFYNVEHAFDKLTYQRNLCELCKRVQEHLRNPIAKVYDNIAKWFVTESQCYFSDSPEDNI